MKKLVLFLMLYSAATVASAAELTWQDLIRKPELRPAQCTLKETLNFQSGVTLRAGQKFDILEINPDEVVVTMPNGNNFSLTPNQTDIVAVANANYAKLTSKQRALTNAEVVKRRDLWSYRLKVKDTFDVGRERIKKGDTVYLMDIKNGKLIVVPSSFSQNFDLKPEDTDLLEQARVHLENPNGAPGIIAEELQGKLVNGVTGAPMNLDMNKLPKYFVIYDAARWCPYTQKFTPQLLKLYQAKKGMRDDFEVFYLPSEKSAAELQMYAKELSFPWPVMSFSQKKKLAALAKVISGHSLPSIQVLDRYGNLIIDNDQYDRDQVLTQLAALLSK